MGMAFIKCYYDFRHQLSALTYEEIGRLFLAMLEYGETGKITVDLVGNEKIMLPAMTASIERDKKSYSKISEKRASAARSRWSSDANASKSIHLHANRCKQCQEEEKENEKEDDVVSTISPTLLEAIQGANRAWEQPAKSILTSFQSLAEEYGEAALIEAIKTAVEHDTQGGVSVVYVKSILKGSGQEPPAEAPTPFDPQKAYGTRDDDIDIRRS